MKAERLWALVGGNIRFYRTRAGLTQEELARLAGINRSYLSDVEQGRRNLRLSTLASISEALEVQPDELLAQHGQQ